MQNNKINIRQEMKCNAMRWKKWTKDSDIGLLVFYEGVMNERCVTVIVRLQDM